MAKSIRQPSVIVLAWVSKGHVPAFEGSKTTPNISNPRFTSNPTLRYDAHADFFHLDAAPELTYLPDISPLSCSPQIPTGKQYITHLSPSLRYQFPADAHTRRERPFLF